MTFEETEIRYIEWDYDTMIAVEYRRYGECNQCGECCRAHIVFRGGGSNEVGVWSEVKRNQTRMFFKTQIVDIENENICASYNRKQECKIHDEERNAICTTWPCAPRDIALVPSCSYWFDEIDSWRIESN